MSRTIQNFAKMAAIWPAIALSAMPLMCEDLNVPAEWNANGL
jgi:hypothetical protein